MMNRPITFVLRLALLLALMVGVLISQVYVIGFQSHRFLAPSWAFTVVAFLLVFLPVQPARRGGVVLLVLLTALSAYVGLRGMYSAAPSLALREYPLLCFGGLAFLGSIVLAQKKWSFWILAGFLGVLFLWQLAIAAADREYYALLFAPFGEIYSSRREMHGFFQHHNPFATYCALSAVPLLCLPFVVKGQVKGKAKVVVSVVLGGFAFFLWRLWCVGEW